MCISPEIPMDKEKNKNKTMWKYPLRYVKKKIVINILENVMNFSTCYLQGIHIKMFIMNMSFFLL